MAATKLNLTEMHVHYVVGAIPTTSDMRLRLLIEILVRTFSNSNK